jgi:hypothetical protein
MIFTLFTTYIKCKTSNHEHENIIVWYLFGYTKGQIEE